MDDNDFQWEQDAGQLDKKYHRGKRIFQKLNQLDSDDSIEIEDFMDKLSPEEWDALVYYNDFVGGDDSSPKSELIGEQTRSPLNIRKEIKEASRNTCQRNQVLFQSRTNVCQISWICGWISICR